MVDVEFETRDGRTLVLPRITVPEQEQAAILLQLGWTLPQQPPPRIRSKHRRGHIEAHERLYFPPWLVTISAP